MGKSSSTLMNGSTETIHVIVYNRADFMWSGLGSRRYLITSAQEQQVKSQLHHIEGLRLAVVNTDGIRVVHWKMCNNEKLYIYRDGRAYKGVKLRKEENLWDFHNRYQTTQQYQQAEDKTTPREENTSPLL